MNKKIIGREELIPKIIEGISEISQVVKTTLGPGGLPILIERQGQALNGDPIGPKITKDGVSVADECGSDDPVKDLVIQAVKHICKKTNTVAGDGTTTAIVLGEAILKETHKILKENTHLNPQLVRESVEAATADALATLAEESIEVKDPKMIEQVATIASNGDAEIGKIIGQAFEAVGAEGVVTVDEGSTINSTLTIVEGYQINRGAEAQNRFYNNDLQTKFEAEDVKVIIYDGKLFNYTELKEALLVIYKANGDKMPPVLIMANEFSREVIQFLLIQRAELGMSFVAVRGPHMSDVRTGYYEDMAAMLGAKKLGNGSRNLKAFELGDEGEAARIVVDKYTTTFYDGKGSEKDILKRVKHLKALRNRAESPYDAQVVGDRLASLTQGIAKIGVGGSTDFEIKEKYDRIEDALNASRAAIEEGIVAGGGTALFRLATKLGQKVETTVGEKILWIALQAPFFQILSNVGVKLLPAELGRIGDEENLIYDARNKQLIDALEAGIIDPVKVTRSALENATSISALLSTAGGGIIFDRD